MTLSPVSELTIIGSANDLSPEWCQAIIETNVGILLTAHIGANFNAISIAILTFSFKKIYLKMSSGKWQPSGLSLDVSTKFRLKCSILHLQIMLQTYYVIVDSKSVDSSHIQYLVSLPISLTFKTQSFNIAKTIHETQAKSIAVY